jgi:hypothetical protein
MKPPAWRLLLTVALFVGWLGYLAYLVWSRPHTPDGRPLVLSQPQFLVSMLDVVAEVKDLHQKVVIDTVLYPTTDPPVQQGEEVRVGNLDQCRALSANPEGTGEAPLDFTGPGKYLLALEWHTKDGERTYEVVPTPPSPGFPPSRHAAGPPRIYPATADMLAEYRRICKPK